VEISGQHWQGISENSWVYLAACRLSNTSRRASSSARIVSLSPSTLESGAFRWPVSYVPQLLLVPVGVNARGVWLVSLCVSRSLITPVLCQVKAFNLVPRPPSTLPFRRSMFAAGGLRASELEVRVGCEPARSCFADKPCLGVLLVMPPRCRRISSTLWMPSGLFLKMYWSRCRPREDEVKCWWQ
jgi:hypothetical protein